MLAHRADIVERVASTSRHGAQLTFSAEDRKHQTANGERQTVNGKREKGKEDERGTVKGKLQAEKRTANGTLQEHTQSSNIS